MPGELGGGVWEGEREARAAFRRWGSGLAVERGGLEAGRGGQKVSKRAVVVGPVSGEGEGPPARLALGKEGVGGGCVGGPGGEVGADERDGRGRLVAGPSCRNCQWCALEWRGRTYGAR